VSTPNMSTRTPKGVGDAARATILGAGHLHVACQRWVAVQSGGHECPDQLKRLCSAYFCCARLQSMPPMVLKRIVTASTDILLSTQ
jgi:hypothetical protein